MADHLAMEPHCDKSRLWTNVFPQKVSAIELLIHAFFLLMGVFIMSISVMSLLSESPSWSLILVNILGGAGLGNLGVMTLRISTLEGARANSTRIMIPGRCTIRTRFLSEPLVHVGFTMLAFGLAAAVFWGWDPYSDFPGGSGRKQSLMPLLCVGAILSFAVFMCMRPWRRRLELTPGALVYRQFGKPVSIPWDTIISLTPEDQGFAKTVTVRLHPPGQPPPLECKQHPDGTAQGNLAIHSMTVDPGTIVYALNRLWKEPESRRLLETPEGVNQLFTGPSWRERIRMAPGQTWAPP